MSPSEVIVVVIQLIFLEGILSIDNAAVLGAMVSVLPANEQIPWPHALRFMHKWGDRVLGGQRAAALKVGLLGAYAGRGLMLFLASIVIQNPWLRLLGAAYLLKLSVEHLGSKYHKEAGEDLVDKNRGRGFWGVVAAVELADLAFSLDNVVAAVALSNRLWVVMLGVALGIITMRFAAQAFTLMIEKEPILVPTAYLLVLNISLELLITEITTWMHTSGFTIQGKLVPEIEFHSLVKFAISVGTIVVALIYARTPVLQRLLRPVLRPIARFLSYLNDGIEIIFRPLGWLFSGLVLIERAVLKAVRPTRS